MSHDGHEGMGTTDATGAGGDMDMDHGMMSMFFHFGKSETILFEFWKTSDVGSLLGSLLIVFLLAIVYEALKFYREYLHRSYMKTLSYNTITVPLENGSSVRETQTVVQVKMFSSMHVIQTVLHVIQFVISYFLMLIFMTYNVWLCLSVAFGAGVGYFLFGWQRSVVVDLTEHCH